MGSPVPPYLIGDPKPLRCCYNSGGLKTQVHYLLQERQSFRFAHDESCLFLPSANALFLTIKFYVEKESMIKKNP